MTLEIENNQDDGASRSSNVLSLHIKGRSALYASFMPFCRNGGIFVPTSRSFAIGEEVFLLLTIMDEPEKHTILGKVVWINPDQVEKRPQGIGVAFDGGDSSKALCVLIENLIAGAQNSTKPTHTI